MDFGLLPPAIELRDHLVLCDADRLRILNPTARRLWEIHRDTQDVGRAVTWLVETYGLTVEQAEQDVEALFAPAVLDEPPAVPAVFPRPAVCRPSPREASGYETYSAPLPVVESPLLGQGGVVSLYCATERLAQALEPLFAHLRVTTAAGPRFTIEADNGFTGWRDQEEIFATTTLDGAVIGLFAAVLEYAAADRNLMASLHAGAVSDGHTALVLPGAGGSGKSTLTAALLTRGYRYLSDDLVPLDYGSGHALPVPVCLNLKAGSVSALVDLYPALPKLPAWRSGNRRLRFLPPPAFAQRRPERAYPVAAMVFPQYQPDAASKLQPLDSVAALTRLMASDARFDLPLNPAKIAALCAWIETTPAYAFAYSDLSTAADGLRSLWP
ncbi:MAG TPA: hypothetical protein PK018_02240 [Candidatus Competibacter sp.]|nr:hypothetical protein [Candidatus Competibacteraceae bacterium]HPE70978.1 hypothetical protein [Candidatus Competibacter sp.]